MLNVKFARLSYWSCSLIDKSISHTWPVGYRGWRYTNKPIVRKIFPQINLCKVSTFGKTWYTFIPIKGPILASKCSILDLKASLHIVYSNALHRKSAIRRFESPQSQCLSKMKRNIFVTSSLEIKRTLNLSTSLSVHSLQFLRTTRPFSLALSFPFKARSGLADFCFQLVTISTIFTV